ncbi:MAG: hypothetical protein KF774_02300 [Planctomyces sp.]|nr:hypothetical protein [Planctomyces sp.]
MRRMISLSAVLWPVMGALAAAEDAAVPDAAPAPAAAVVEEAAPAAQPPAKKQPKVRESAGEEVVELYPLDGEEWLKDPFLVLDMEMEAVVIDLNEKKAKPPAEVTQPRIVSRFDSLIEILERSCSGTGPGGPMPNRPAEASVIRKGPGGMGELRAPKTNGKGYADLTPKEREKILQSKTEGFPPGFEDVLADYFRRLSTAEAAAVPAADTAAPGSE